VPLVRPAPVVMRPQQPVHRTAVMPKILSARPSKRAPATAPSAAVVAPVTAVSAVVVVPPPAQVVASSPPVAPSAPPPPTAASIDPAILGAYDAKLTAAVQAAFHAPSTAADMNFKGRVRIEFNLRDGVVTNVRVDVPSGLGAVDRAAVKAVQMASYPLPPQVLLGKDGTYQIWVACI
jgi:periplasmic protein TonB